MTYKGAKKEYNQFMQNLLNTMDKEKVKNIIVMFQDESNTYTCKWNADHADMCKAEMVLRDLNIMECIRVNKENYSVS